MCQRKAGHPLNTALAPPCPVVCGILVGHRCLLAGTKGEGGWKGTPTSQLHSAHPGSVQDPHNSHALTPDLGN